MMSFGVPVFLQVQQQKLIDWNLEGRTVSMTNLGVIKAFGFKPF